LAAKFIGVLNAIPKTKTKSMNYTLTSSTRWTYSAFASLEDTAYSYPQYIR